jgi:hypothetical protein
MQNNAIITLNNNCPELPKGSVLNLNTESDGATFASRILKFVLVKKPQNLIIHVNEENLDPYFLNKIVLFLKKTNSSLKLFMSTNFLINDLYKSYIRENLIEDVLLDLSPKDLENFVLNKDLKSQSPVVTETEQEREKILLIAPLAWSPHFPQLGLAYISASLKEEGYDVDIIDCNIDFFLGNKLLESERQKFKNMPSWIDPDIYYSFTHKEASKYIYKILERIKKNKVFQSKSCISPRTHVKVTLEDNSSRNHKL